MNWYLEVLKKYAVFSGRARRKEFWMFVLVNFVITLVLGFIDNVAGLAGSSGSYGVLSGLYALAVLLPTLGVSIRRLHDTNRSGWWLLIALIPLIGLIVLIIFYVKEGDPGQNQYGPNPKEAAA